MRVTSSTFPNNLVNQLQQLTSKMNTLQQQASTGQRVIAPSDDPAAASRVLNYQSERNGLAQFQRNALRAEDLLNASNTQIQNLLDVSERANEVISLTNDVFNGDDMVVYATEIDALLEQALVNGNARFNDEPLFGGTTAAMSPFTATRDAQGRITAVTYVGSATTAQIQVAEGSTISPYSSATENQEIAGFLNGLVSLRDALNTRQSANVRAVAPAMQASEDHLILQLSAKGALLSRVEVDKTQNATRYTNLAEQISRDADTDLAQAVVQLSQNQNAYQAALMSASKVLNKSLLDYL
jgi:flagellar hook-associated protein 3 FlgL